MFLLKNKIKVAVHSGAFHPDDVFSVALLSILFDGKIKVFRTRDEKVYGTCDFVVDVGLVHDVTGKKFDHHQEGGAGKRPNGISYSSFGLLWSTYGEKVCNSKKVADIVDHTLVQIIDADDTGFNLCDLKLKDVSPFSITDAIYAFYPTWKESYTLDEAFTDAVDFAKKILVREIKTRQDTIAAESIVDDIYKKAEDKRIIIFENNMLPKSLLTNYPEPLFTVYKEKDGNAWRVTAIRKSEHGFEVRKTFPQRWAAKTGTELVEITGVSDATFCHGSCVYAGAKSREGAIKLAQLALENQ
jgi:uncharacterized UPF0160 family protein